MPKKLIKAGGRDIEELRSVSKEIEKRMKLKDQIDLLLGKLKKQQKKKSNSDVEELIRLRDKQIKLELK